MKSHTDPPTVRGWVRRKNPQRPPSFYSYTTQEYVFPGFQRGAVLAKMFGSVNLFMPIGEQHLICSWKSQYVNVNVSLPSQTDFDNVIGNAHRFVAPGDTINTPFSLPFWTNRSRPTICIPDNSNY